MINETSLFRQSSTTSSHIISPVRSAHGDHGQERETKKERVAGLYVKSCWWAHGPWELPL